jgi:KEOPS complex subunit Cgi121
VKRVTAPDHSYEIRAATFNVADQKGFLITLRRIARDTNTTIICFDADRMAGKRHADAAIRHALRSFHQGAPIADTLEMEALLYASGSRQCSVAAGFGIHAGINHAYICCCPRSQRAWDALSAFMQWADEAAEEIAPEKRQRLKSLFSISDEEIEAVGESRFADLVLERVALLEVYR